ncbi:MAG: CHAT domain-containing protein, partial [Bacteroidota bacterium]
LSTFQAGAANPYATFPVEEARFLYAQLVAPLEFPPGMPVTFVPDAALYLLPFGALLTDDPQDGENYHNWPWLAAERRVNHAFSVQLLDFARQQRGRGNGKALALAPVARLTATAPLEAKLELPATLRTARHLTTLFPTDTLINAAANRANFRERANDYSLLHLGTHAYLGGEDEGGFLLHDQERARYTTTDLADHQFTADLVIVGACETGQGEQIVGEGVASLGRAFARRGAPSLVMSLWSIDDAATAELLNASYDRLAEGDGPASALYAAGAAYRAEVTNPGFGHPYYWAGLVAYGPDIPLAMGQTNFGLWPWLAGGILLLSLALLFLRRR